MEHATPARVAPAMPPRSLPVTPVKPPGRANDSDDDDTSLVPWRQWQLPPDPEPEPEQRLERGSGDWLVSCSWSIARKHLEAEIQNTELQLLEELDRKQTTANFTATETERETEMEIERQRETETERQRHASDNVQGGLSSESGSAPASRTVAGVSGDTSDVDTARLQACLTAAQQEAAEMRQRAVAAEAQLLQAQVQSDASLARLQEELAATRAAGAAAQAEAASWRTSAQAQLEVVRHKANEQSAALRSALGALQRLRPQYAESLAELGRARCEAAKALEAQRAAQRDAVLLRQVLRQHTHEVAAAQAAATSLEKRLQSMRRDHIAQASIPSVQPTSGALPTPVASAENAALATLHESIGELFEGVRRGNIANAATRSAQASCATISAVNKPVVGADTAAGGKQAASIDASSSTGSKPLAGAEGNALAALHESIGGLFESVISSARERRQLASAAVSS